MVCNAQPSIPLYDRSIKKALKVPQIQNRGCVVLPLVFRIILIPCVQYFQVYFGGFFVLYCTVGGRAQMHSFKCNSMKELNQGLQVTSEVGLCAFQTKKRILLSTLCLQCYF